MKIPRKKDILRLQEQYKTDKKIGEALGNVPEYLVSYWRRKKNIPIYSAPKFSFSEIEEAWLRHGDDFKAGRELNLSKAAFYSWRRKYGLMEKPKLLKLEQLELTFSPHGEGSDQRRNALPAPTSIKIWKRMAESSGSDKLAPAWRLENVEADGDYFSVGSGKGVYKQVPPPEYIGPVINRPHLDARAWGDRGFGRADWQLIEGRVIRPGETIVGDGNDLGGLGGIAALCLLPDLARPKTVGKIEFARNNGPKIDVEDRFMEFMLRYPAENWKNTILEYLGIAVERLSLDRKIKLAQLTTFFGAAAALCPLDDSIRRHYPRNVKAKLLKAFPDRGAVYDKEYLLEGRSRHVHLARFDRRWEVLPGPEAEGRPLQTVVIGPAALPYEIAYAAEALDGRRIPRTISLIVMPVSATTAGDSRRHGWLENLMKAGATMVDPRLAARIGLAGLIDRNSGDVLFTRPPVEAKKLTKSGRSLWFSSIRTAAASAVCGRITLP